MNNLQWAKPNFACNHNYKSYRFFAPINYFSNALLYSLHSHRTLLYFKGDTQVLYVQQTVMLLFF